MTRAFSRHKDPDPLRSLAPARIPHPMPPSSTKRGTPIATRDASYLPHRVPGARSSASSATKEASRRRRRRRNRRAVPTEASRVDSTQPAVPCAISTIESMRARARGCGRRAASTTSCEYTRARLCMHVCARVHTSISRVCRCVRTCCCSPCAARRQW